MVGMLFYMGHLEKAPWKNNMGIETLRMEEAH